MSDQKLKLASVTTLQDSNFRNIPATLRKIADAIERGEFGVVVDVAIVTQGERLNVFHAGAGDAGGVHILLACGQRKLENAVLRATGNLYEG